MNYGDTILNSENRVMSPELGLCPHICASIPGQRNRETGITDPDFDPDLYACDSRSNCL